MIRAEENYSHLTVVEKIIRRRERETKNSRLCCFGENGLQLWESLGRLKSYSCLNSVPLGVHLTWAGSHLFFNLFFKQKIEQKKREKDRSKSDANKENSMSCHGDAEVTGQWRFLSGRGGVSVCVHEVGFVFRGVERMCDLSVGIRKFSFCVSSFTFSVCLSPRDFFFFFTSLSLLCYLSITNTSDTSDLIGHKQLISSSSFSPPPPPPPSTFLYIFIILQPPPAPTSFSHLFHSFCVLTQICVVCGEYVYMLFFRFICLTWLCKVQCTYSCWWDRNMFNMLVSSAVYLLLLVR